MNANRLLFGIIVIGIGLLFLLNSTGVADLNRLLDWWPSLIILYGVWRLIANRFRSLFWPIALIAIGAFLQLGQLGFDISWNRYWPVALIAVGILILGGGLRRRRRRRRNSSNPHNSSSRIIDVDVSTSQDADDATLHAVVGSQDRIISGDFHGGSINVVMGSGTLDMRDARIVDKPATLEVSVVMGEVKVRIPIDWSVQVANAATMGEVKDTRSQRNESGNPDLIISGSVTMGSLQVTD
ncbi:MAG: DUF5668 domain-containing protein [Chloroflexota bacterium]|nr:DUF5668 domain-containing protein [Chloroflexota bacterium]